jgi:hypothetical protein
MNTLHPKASKLLILAIAIAGAVHLPVFADETQPNILTAKEKAAGWRLLFDGKAASHWRNFGKTEFPAGGWEFVDGWLIKKAGAKPGNIVTRKEYTDFEFSWEWRMAASGNNGVKYFVDEKRGNLGHEYQMLTQPGRKLNKGSNAAFYAVLAPRTADRVKVAPEVGKREDLFPIRDRKPDGQ